MKTFFLSSIFAIVASAQSTLYTDANSGITFQAFTHSSGYTFGLALPSITDTDFVGLLIGKGSGWAGVSLGGSMVNKLLVAAWPNENAIVTSFRRAGAYAPPPEVDGLYTVTPIANGTYVNSTHYALTFLCEGCIQSDGSTFLAGDSSAFLGFAMCNSPPADKADHASALVFHDAKGNFAIDLTSANTTSSMWVEAKTASLRKRRQIRLGGSKMMPH